MIVDVDTASTSTLHALVLAGGRGERLGARSKADLRLGGRRLLDRVLDALAPLAGGTTVVVAPPTVAVPTGVERTMEQPAGGGPLAGIGAGLAVIAAGGGGRAAGRLPRPDDLVIVCSVDTPGIATLVPRLLGVLAGAGSAPGQRTPNRSAPPDGALIRGGSPEPFRQYLQGVYRLGALAALLDREPTLRNLGVSRVMSRLDLVEVSATSEECRDVDTPADVAWWEARLRAVPPPQSSPSWE